MNTDRYRQLYLSVPLVLGIHDECHANQMRQAARGHLAHDIGAMDFDSARADPQIIGDCLVRQTRHKSIQHLPLPIR